MAIAESELQSRLEALGLAVPEVVLPAEGVDLTKWAVIAVDQYTSEPQYWEDVEGVVGSSPSTLRLVYPEVHLSPDNDEKYVQSISSHMEEYDRKKVFRSPLKSIILTERSTPNIPSRQGLVVALDLEAYDFKPNAGSLVRATEQTIEARLPPRIKIREQVGIEFPHILVIVDDPDHSVMEPLFATAKDEDLVYNFGLMKGAGQLKGWHLGHGERGSERLNSMVCALEKLLQCQETTGKEQKLLFVVGDGNHSLATAKQVWESTKKQLESEGKSSHGHPARHALVEIGNIHTSAYEFEPIHRLLFDAVGDIGDGKFATAEDVRGQYASFLRGIKADASVEFEPGKRLSEVVDTATGAVLNGSDRGTQFHEVRMKGIADGIEWGLLKVQNSPFPLPVGSLQAFLDEVLKITGKSMELDYIHGTAVVDRHIHANEKTGHNHIAFLLPTICKSDLIPAVRAGGVLPRKTFSIGHADDKRFYMEGRRIK